jgi:mannose/fructose/N-acetylgalactosamine-specific phosphotransferase system component IIB
MRFDNDLNLIYEADLTVSMQNRWVKYYQYNSYTGDIFLKCKNDDTKKIDYVIHYTPEGKTGSFDLPVTEGEKILNSVYSYNKEEKTYSFFAFGTNLYNGPKDYSGVAYVYKEFDQNEVLRTEYKNYKRDEILSDPVLKNFISQSSPKYTFSSTDNFGKISLEQNSVNILPNGDFLLMVKNLKEAKKVKDLKAPINSCNLIVCVGKDGKEKWKKVLPLAPDTSPYRNTISTDNTLTMILPVNKDLYNEKGELLEYQSGTRDHIMAFQFDLETGHYENPVFIPFPERSIPCKHIKHYNPENKHFVLGLEPRSFMPPHNAKFVPINLEK